MLDVNKTFIRFEQPQIMDWLVFVFPFFKRDLARALLRISFVVLVLVLVFSCPVSPSVKFHVTFTILCQFAI